MTKRNKGSILQITSMAICSSLALIPATGWADNIADTIQLKNLFEPSQPQLRREANGHIYIYDGLTDRVVNQAMDEQFSRIQNMMFVGTIVTDDQGEPAVDDQGEVIAEDDGCD